MFLHFLAQAFPVLTHTGHMPQRSIHFRIFLRIRSQCFRTILRQLQVILHRTLRRSISGNINSGYGQIGICLYHLDRAAYRGKFRFIVLELRVYVVTVLTELQTCHTHLVAHLHSLFPGLHKSCGILRPEQLQERIFYRRFLHAGPCTLQTSRHLLAQHQAALSHPRLIGQSHCIFHLLRLSVFTTQRYISAIGLCRSGQRLVTAVYFIADTTVQHHRRKLQTLTTLFRHHHRIKTHALLTLHMHLLYIKYKVHMNLTAVLLYFIIDYAYA